MTTRHIIRTARRAGVVLAAAATLSLAPATSADAANSSHACQAIQHSTQWTSISPAARFLTCRPHQYDIAHQVITNR